jgi:hypothetical protein
MTDEEIEAMKEDVQDRLSLGREKAKQEAEYSKKLKKSKDQRGKRWER